MNEVEDQLPNGFHDGLLRGMRVDYVAAVLTLDVDFWVGDLDKERREIYRCGRVTVSGLGFIAIDNPNMGSGPLVGELMIDGAVGEPHTSIIPLPKFDPACFLYWIFVQQWNGFIRFAARTASLEWTGPAVDRGLNDRGP